MSTKAYEPVSFLSYYNPVVQSYRNKAKAVAESLDSRRRNICMAISNIESKPNNMIEHYISRLNSVDDDTKQLLRTIAESRFLDYCSPRSKLEQIQETYSRELKPLDFFSKKLTDKLLKPKPFEKEFQLVEDEIDYYTSKIADFEAELRRLISKKALKILAFCQNRAMAFIEQVIKAQDDPYRVLDDTFNRHYSVIWCEITAPNPARDTEADNDEDCIFLNISTQHKKSPEPFMVFSPTKKYRQIYKEKYGERFLTFNYDDIEDYVVRMFFYVLTTILTDVTINYNIGGSGWNITLEPLDD